MLNAKHGRKYRRAVVIGAGAAGLVAASAIASLFDEIVIVDKDDPSSAANPRKSVAQGAHLHSLLLGGLKLLELYYPGITAQLKSAGAAEFRAGLGQHIFETGQWLPKRDLGLEILSMSRPLLESVIRAETQKIKNIKFQWNTKVDDVCFDSSGAVMGVLTSPQVSSAAMLSADVVVDASGVAAVLVKKLAKQFEGLDGVDQVQSKIVYCSAILEKPAEWLGVKENVLIVPEPSQSAGGALLDIEGDQWCVSLHGRHGVAPPSTPKEWKLFARELPAPAIWERIESANIIGSIHVFKKPISSFRRYDLCNNMPIGYFPVGDTISSVNPIFGQGMTVAWGHAHSLAQALASDDALGELQTNYILNANKWSDRAWRRSAAYDALFEKAEQNTEKANKELALIRKLALARLQKIQDDPSEHLFVAKQAHMLDAFGDLV